MKKTGLLLLVLLTPLAHAANVRVEVSVLADGAKFIGDKTGGARITIEDAERRETLAEGITRGGTGSTPRIMGGEGGLYKDVFSEDDAVFATELALERPRKVTVTATGPLDYPQALHTASKTLWLLPGHDLEGPNRIVLTLSGYLIKPVETAINEQGTGRLRVSLEMLCGCPVEPGGTWNAERIRKTATLTGAGGVSESVELDHTGEGIVYEARFSGKVRRPRSVRVDVSGMDNDNTGTLYLPLMQ